MLAPLTAVLLAAAPAELPLVHVQRDNLEITESCRVHVLSYRIPDADSNGVIHITGSDIEVRFSNTPLRGSFPDQMPDTYTGTAIRITGHNVTLSGADITGYKIGIHATGADGLTLDDCRVTNNYRQQLRSTIEAEHSADWLRPHENDNNEWLERYGAGVCIEDSTHVTARKIKVREGQNGIILDQVEHSRIYDNDCSFLSGWGLAMWRSSHNIISRNALDFCIRGYSHGVYNRGQDSAGILMFEQCTDNVIAENSATHGGDGLFGYAGREALGEVDPREDTSWYRRRGNSNNLMVGNDFSYAAAHGVEMTFSFGNRLYDNRFVGNAICGIWGGYSQETVIADNTFQSNGEMGYGLERGAINIEHGAKIDILENRFAGNRCGVHLWWDDDGPLLATPWAMSNGTACRDNTIANNSFTGDELAVHLRQAADTLLNNNSAANVKEFLREEESTTITDRGVPHLTPKPLEYPCHGETRPVGARPHFQGREHIHMTAWGPYDHQGPLLVFDGRRADGKGRPYIAFRMLGAVPLDEPRIQNAKQWAHSQSSDAVHCDLTPNPEAGVMWSARFTAIRPGVHAVNFSLGQRGGPPIVERHTLSWIPWHVRHFASPVDPREDEDTWRRAALDVEPIESRTLDLRWAMDGPGGALAPDHFGTVAESAVILPAGWWIVRTRSDDGIRVWVDDALLIDDWTMHAPVDDEARFEVFAERSVRFRVEHFELAGHAELTVELLRAPALERPTLNP